MNYKYEELDVYKLSRKYIIEIYKLIGKLPKEEMFGLSSQARRAVVSIILNIVEGTSRKSKKDFAIFIERSIGSLIETRTILDIAIDLGYIEIESVSKLQPQISELFFKLQALKRSLRSEQTIPTSNNSNK